MRQPDVGFATRQIIQAWIDREPRHEIPWTPLRKPLAECTVALLSTAALARTGDAPFDQEGERRNPWWGDPSYRVLPRGTCTGEVACYHLHINPDHLLRDLDCTLPLTRLEELVQAGEVGAAAPSHYSIQGYLLRPDAMLRESVPRIVDTMKQEAVDVALLVPV